MSPSKEAKVLSPQHEEALREDAHVALQTHLQALKQTNNKRNRTPVISQTYSLAGVRGQQ